MRRLTLVLLVLLTGLSWLRADVIRLDQEKLTLNLPVAWSPYDSPSALLAYTAPKSRANLQLIGVIIPSLNGATVSKPSMVAATKQALETKAETMGLKVAFIHEGPVSIHGVPFYFCQGTMNSPATNPVYFLYYMTLANGKLYGLTMSCLDKETVPVLEGIATSFTFQEPPVIDWSKPKTLLQWLDATGYTPEDVAAVVGAILGALIGGIAPVFFIRRFFPKFYPIYLARLKRMALLGMVSFVVVLIGTLIFLSLYPRDRTALLEKYLVQRTPGKNGGNSTLPTAEEIALKFLSAARKELTPEPITPDRSEASTPTHNPWDDLTAADNGQPPSARNFPTTITDLKTDQTYQRCALERADTEGITIIHAGGTVRIPYSHLNRAFAVSFGYHPENDPDAISGSEVDRQGVFNRSRIKTLQDEISFMEAEDSRTHTNFYSVKITNAKAKIQQLEKDNGE